jgi:ABC-2 type transport system permease protein
VLFTFIIPLGFISFYPAAGFLGKDSGFDLPLDLTVWTPIVAIIMFIITQLFFKKGMRRYESAGS